MIDSQLIAVHVFARCIFMLNSVDEMLLPSYVNLFTNLTEPPFRMEMLPSWLKRAYSVLSLFTWRPMPTAACSSLYSWYSAWGGVFERTIYIYIYIYIYRGVLLVSRNEILLHETKRSENVTRWCCILTTIAIII